MHHINQLSIDLDTDPLPASPATQLCIIILQSAIEFIAPPSWSAFFWIIAIALLCLLVSAFISGSEIAFFGLTPQEEDEIDEKASTQSPQKAASAARSLMSDMERLLATILITNNLVNVTMVILMTFAIHQTVKFNSEAVNFLVQTVFLTFLLLLFGEILPKLIARGQKMKWVLAAAPTLKIIYRILGPAAKLMARSTKIVNRLVTKKQESISTDELSTALEISDVEAGRDKEILEGILTLGEKDAAAIMISRVDVTAIEYHATWQNVVRTIIETGYSRIPVYDTSQDTIKGILYAKDLLPHIGRADDRFDWQKLIRPPYFVPESRPIDDLLEDFRRKHIHIAIVVDEYGGTQGIVTLEDIIEEIVGEIDDEYDAPDITYRRIGHDLYDFEAKTSIIDFCRAVGLPEDTFNEFDDVETLAGLALAVKGDFPTPGELIEVAPIRMRVLKIEKHRIVTLRVRVLNANADNQDTNTTNGD